MTSSNPDLFHPVLSLPDSLRSDRYARLVGLEDVKLRLRKEAAVLADPSVLTRWAGEHHSDLTVTGPAFTALRDRAPLILFTGDVGCGKSALAESFGCDLADWLDVEVSLFRLKLTARGTGHVGQMTALITAAFETVTSEARLGRRADGRVSAVTVLVIDEADALVQSREATHMHHEDRAGVDAFLAGIDALAGTGIPLLVVMCTNRPASLDPAVKRRAAAIFEFSRPTDEQRRIVLQTVLGGFDLSDDTIEALVAATGAREHGGVGFTYSDLTQRLVPATILAAFPDKPVTADLVLAVATGMNATPEFGDREAA